MDVFTPCGEVKEHNNFRRRGFPRYQVQNDTHWYCIDSVLLKISVKYNRAHKIENKI